MVIDWTTAHGKSVAASMVLAGCGMSDDLAQVNEPRGALAVGAFHSLRFGDACRGGGKLNVCSTESVTELHHPQSSEADVVRVIERAEHPMGNELPDPFFLVGEEPGRASIHIEGEFDDGSTRSVDFEVEVQAISDVSADVSCPNGEATNEAFVPVDIRHHGVANLANGEGILVGWRPDVVEGPGIQQGFADDNRILFSWDGLGEPGSIEVRSPLTNQVVATLHAFGPDDVTAIELEHRNTPPVRTSAAGDFYVDSFVLIGKRRPCKTVTVNFHSDTPDICSGPAGLVVWPGENEYGGRVTANAEGICKLGASIDGENVLGRLDFPVFFVEPVALEDRPGFGNPCAVEGSTTCAGQTRGLCLDGKWTIDGQCPDDQTCDLIPNTDEGCVGEGPCSACRSLR